MAHKKAGGSSRNGRDTAGKHLGVKSGDGKTIHAGTIIIRQRGTNIHAGQNVGVGRDYTLYAKVTGIVQFERMGRDKKRVNIIPA